jgi:cytochrome c peroxidase
VLFGDPVRFHGSRTGQPETAPCQHPMATFHTTGQVTAVTFVTPTSIAAQAREPAGIFFIDATRGSVQLLDLAQPTRYDSGHALFHQTTPAGLACASCHAEAGDDGHVWKFEGIGARRTQSLRGGILGTEPFHWEGDLHDFSVLVAEVFVERMGGPMPPAQHSAVLARWLDRQPVLRATPNDPAAVERGRQLFTSEAVGCAKCHSGPHFTNNETADVGTGVRVQVPALQGLSFRAPFMHDGCAAQLRERFTVCGGGDLHGRTSQLSVTQLDDLTAYLETL